MRHLRERPWVLGALTALFFLGVVGVRTISESRTELAAADAYGQNGDAMRALEHYRRTMRWSLPLNPYPARAATSLQRMAEDFRDAGRIDDALLALRSIVGSSTATRFLYSTTSSQRQDAKDEIARLMAADQRAGIDAGMGAGDPEAAHRTLLADGPSPDPLWGTLLLIGFAAWIGGLVVTCSRGFDPAGRLQWLSARAPLSGALAGFVMFVLGMLLA